MGIPIIDIPKIQKRKRNDKFSIKIVLVLILVDKVLFIIPFSNFKILSSTSFLISSGKRDGNKRPKNTETITVINKIVNGFLAFKNFITYITYYTLCHSSIFKVQKIFYFFRQLIYNKKRGVAMSDKVVKVIAIIMLIATIIGFLSVLLYI